MNLRCFLCLVARYPRQAASWFSRCVGLVTRSPALIASDLFSLHSELYAVIEAWSQRAMHSRSIADTVQTCYRVICSRMNALANASHPSSLICKQAYSIKTRSIRSIIDLLIRFTLKWTRAWIIPILPPVRSHVGDNINHTGARHYVSCG